MSATEVPLTPLEYLSILVLLISVLYIYLQRELVVLMLRFLPLLHVLQ